MPRLAGLASDTGLLRAKNARTPLGPDSAGKAHVPYVSNDAKATPVGAFHYYSSGRLALFENRMYAGNYYILYSDTERNVVLCQFDPLGQGTACFANGKPRLTSTKAGGTYVDEAGNILSSWTDKKPLKGDGISFALNNAASFSFKNRYDIQLKLSLGGQAYEFELGEQLVHGAANYQQKKLGTHSLGPERGKAIIDVSSLDRSKGKPTEASLGRRTRVTEADLTIAALHPILRDAEEMKVRVQGMVSTPWIESTVMPSRAFGSTGDPADFQKSMDDPRWASFLGKTPASDYAALPVSAVLKGASGRYRPGAGAKSGRVRLRLLPARSYDDLLAPGEGGLSQDMLVVVCCLASWLPQSNRAEAWLETLNGELAAERAGSNGAPPPFVLAKFDMSQSRLLRDRYNINTLPMYLMYYNGRLAYASNVLNGFGTGKEDMRAQAAKTTALAQAGHFLPDGFRFGSTDNALMDDMNVTLKGLSGRS